MDGRELTAPPLRLRGEGWEGSSDLPVDLTLPTYNKLATQRPGDTTERRSRYQRLMEDIIASGVKTKVLLLSATPVNNQLADLRNQISFIAGGDVARDDIADAAFAEKLAIPSVRDTSRQAQTQFTNWAKRPHGQRKTRELIAEIGGDLFKLSDGLSTSRL